MSMSINTNAGAFVALQMLNKTNQELTTTQNRINTGLRVASARDNSAAFAIAQNLRGDLRGLSAAMDSMRRASSVLDVGINATETVQDLLIELKGKAVAASDAGIDTESRAALLRDYNALSAQMTDIINAASFSGTNLVSATPASLSAIIDDSGARTIAVAGVNLGAQLTFARTMATNVTTATIQAQLAAIDASMANVSATLSTFSAKANQIETQLAFTQKLSDAVETGLGKLIDADLAREHARLQSLQIKQQLGIQALSIANQAPQSILALFN